MINVWCLRIFLISTTSHERLTLGSHRTVAYFYLASTRCLRLCPLPLGSRTQQERRRRRHILRHVSSRMNSQNSRRRLRPTSSYTAQSVSQFWRDSDVCLTCVSPVNVYPLAFSWFLPRPMYIVSLQMVQASRTALVNSDEPDFLWD